MAIDVCECRAASFPRPADGGDVVCGQCGRPPRACPVCGRTRLLPQSEWDAIRATLKELGFAGETMDPGGRVISFADGRRLRLSDMCDSCDFDKIREFAALAPEKHPSDA